MKNVYGKENCQSWVNYFLEGRSRGYMFNIFEVFVFIRDKETCPIFSDSMIRSCLKKRCICTYRGRASQWRLIILENYEQ